MQRGGAGLVAGGPKPASRTAFLALPRLHAARQDSRPLGPSTGPRAAWGGESPAMDAAASAWPNGLARPARNRAWRVPPRHPAVLASHRNTLQCVLAAVLGQH